MSNRFLKQLIFGVFYLAIFGGTFYVVYLLSFQGVPSCFDNRRNQGEVEIDCGGPCVPCELKHLSPISFFGEPEILPIDKESVAVFFRVKNPNAAYGAESLRYTLNFYDIAGIKLGETSGSTFVYPGRIRALVEVPIKLSAERVTRVDLKVSDLKWRSKADFDTPSVQSRNIKVEFPQKDQAKITGVVLNNNSFPLSSADIMITIGDKLGTKIGASRTILRDLLPFQERAFSVFLPLAGQFINPDATEVFVEALR